VVIKITYYTKTKTDLGNDEYTIYETFPPNTSKTINLKINNYKNVNSIDVDVVDAEVYK
jgi:hypothetical protein